jgi:hypothetical protein
MRFEMGLVLVVLAVPACSSSSSPAGASDAGSGGDASGDASTPVEASLSDDAGGGAAADAPDDGPTVCTTLVNAGQPVTASQVATAAPPFQGGTIAEGTYVLTSETVYTGPGGATGPGSTQSITIRIQSGTIEVAKDTDPPTSTYMLAPTGTTYVATGQCPPMLGDIVGSYTATTTTFVASLGAPGGDGGTPTNVDTFTKQ